MREFDKIKSRFWNDSKQKHTSKTSEKTYTFMKIVLFTIKVGSLVTVYSYTSRTVLTIM